MFLPATAFITANQQLAGTVQSSRGLFQGSILSPLLFSIFIDDLISSTNIHTPTLFFADDINIKSRNVTDGQKSLRECEQWAILNEMKWTISKCGIVGPQRGFTLDDTELPVCETYKYLGIPHAGNRVMWDRYLAIVLKKHDDMITALNDHAKLWSPIVRLAVWRTFIRPLIEYCLPITLAWIDRQPNHPGRKNLLSSFKKAMCFIGQNGSYRQLVEYLTGIGPLNTRLESLKCGLAYHLQNLSTTNPIHRLRDVAPTCTHDIIKDCFTHPWVIEAENLDTGELKPHPRIKLRIVMMNKRTLALETGYIGNLKSYILKEEGSLTDQSIKHQNDMAMKWRMNLLFLNRKCICGLRFHRGHIRDCGLIDDHPLVVSTRNTPKYLDQKEELHATAADKLHFNFNCMDFLINESKLTEFDIIANHLKVKLVFE
jgi:hypothetical protein